MRKMRIDGNKVTYPKGMSISCPLANHPELSDGCCYANCAWFRIEKTRDKNNQAAYYGNPFAYCGDKVIGEIVEIPKNLL